MDGARTRGQPTALTALEAMLRGGVPHALILAGPTGVGKTTLAMDLAAALLCETASERRGPCRSCRACRLVEAGHHPDLHRLAPSGPGGVIGIGGAERGRGVRDLVAELSLLPVEGGWRVAVIEDAQRLTEEAQSALLKTLEEPPAGVVLVLCVDEEERLLPTVRSRCVRVRLAPVAAREIEAILAERDLAGPPLAGRLARLAGGRPGLAVAYARSPEAEAIRSEIARRLLDLRAAGVAPRLAAVRELAARAGDLGRLVEAAAREAPPVETPRRRRSRSGAGGEVADAGDGSAEAPDGAGQDGDEAVAGGGSAQAVDASSAGAPRPAAAERRRAALGLLGIWQDVARDLALVAVGERARIRDVALLEDLEAAVAGEPGVDGERTAPDDGESASASLARLARAAELISGNVSPELVLDSVMIHWGRSGPRGLPARGDASGEPLRAGSRR